MTTYVESVKPVSAAQDVPNLTVIDDPYDPYMSTFQVNTLQPNSYGTVDPQTVLISTSEVSVSMNSSGNFTIAWASQGQYQSFFNEIYARQFTADGRPVNIEFLVSQNDANAHTDPYVALSDDGLLAIAWLSFTPQPIGSGYFVDSLDAVLMGANGTIIKTLTGIGVAGGGVDTATIAFDAADQFLVTWTQLRLMTP